VRQDIALARIELEDARLEEIDLDGGSVTRVGQGGPWRQPTADNRARDGDELSLAFVEPASAQISQLAEMKTQQIRALDRAKTAIILPGGILEEHGPYLPSFSDGYLNGWLAARLAEHIIARPGWAARRTSAQEPP
jgi:hypothetical protein